MLLQDRLGEELLEFENAECIVEINRPKRYKEERCFIVSCTDEKNLELTYDTQNGLTLLSDQTDDAKDAVTELHAVGKIYSEYKQLKEKKRAEKKEKLTEAEDKLQKYIETFGFFFDLLEGDRAVYKSEGLLRLVERLFMLMELKQEVNAGTKINYNRVFELTFFFVFSVPPEIEYRDGDEIKKLDMKFYHIAEDWAQGSRWLRRDEVIWSEITPDMDIHPEELRNALYGPSDLLRGYKYWEDADEILKRLDELREMYHQENSDCNIADQDITDFLCGFAKDVASIYKIYPDGTIRQKLGNRLGNSDSFKKYKDSLIRIAKNVCAYEISKGIKEAIPVCDSNTLNMKWKVPNLFSALYFSLFYIGKREDIYRICLHCRTLFKIKKGERHRQYCSNECMKNGPKW